jgi:solute carrier family 50 (sugar transporter)
MLLRRLAPRLGPRIARHAQRDLHSVLPLLGTIAAEAGTNAAAVATVAAPLVSPAVVTFLQVSPPIAGQVLFLSPMAAMRQFREEGTTGGVSIIPYAAMAANGLAWSTYGALGADLTIMLPNASGCVLGLYYTQQFYKYKAPDAVVLPYIGGATAFSAAVVGAAATMPLETARMAIGYGGVAVCIAMFSGPLAAIQTVLRERSAAAIPLAMALASTANCTLWTSYGALVIHDPFVWGPNGLGLLASVTQLGLIARFGTAAPKLPP